MKLRECFKDFMLDSRITIYFAQSVLMVACLVPSATNCSSNAQTTGNRGNSLKAYLQNFVGESDPSLEKDKQTEYSAVFVDLKDDGSKEVIVYLSGQAWCGSGGCTMLIVAPQDQSYRVVTEVPITRLPIRMLATKSNGWHDIGVVVAGGGILQGYEAKLSFDGRRYPHNPSTAPAHRLNTKVKGTVVMPSTVVAEPLYP